MRFESIEFTGWVDHIFPRGQYGQEFSVRDHKDDSDKTKYPTTLRFNVSNKCGSMVDSLGKGDKVKVKFYLTGASGIGKNGYYAINKLNVAKEGGITILEKARILNDSAEVNNADEGGEEDLPF
jgi:hypothetical protein